MKNVLSTALTVLLTSTPIFAGQLSAQPVVQNLEKVSLFTATSQNNTTVALKQKLEVPSEKKVVSEKAVGAALKVKLNQKINANQLKGVVDPGGGGFYRNASTGKLESVPEMGLIIQKAFDEVYKEKKYPELYLIGQDVQDEVAVILKKTPYLELRKILPSRDTFLRADISDVEYEKIKKDYASVVDSYKAKLDPNSFVLAAFSKNNKTYMLKAYDQLSVRQKAVNLIHEYFMRTVDMEPRKKLNFIFQFEAQVISMISAEEPSELDLLNYYSALKNLVSIDSIDWKVLSLTESLKRDKLNNAVKDTMQKLNRPVLLSEFVIDADFPRLRFHVSTMNPSLTQKFNVLVPSFSEITNEANIYIQDLVVELNINRGLRRTHSDDFNSLTDQDKQTYLEKKNQATEMCVKYNDLVAGSDVKNDLLIYLTLESGVRIFNAVSCQGEDAKPYAMGIRPAGDSPF